MSFAVLFVCTGNVCRSPIAELSFRHLIGPRADVTVASAGTGALVGQGMDRSSAYVLEQVGIDPSRHRARQFEPWMAEQANLILTAERSHRDQIITEVPATFRRTFTMKEFARLARFAPSAGPTEVVSALGRMRGIHGHVSLAADNVPDPYQGPVNLAREIADQVRETVEATITALGLRAAPANPRPPVPAADAARRPRPYRS